MSVSLGVTELVGAVVILLSYWKVPSFNLGQAAGYPDWFVSVPPGIYWDATMKYHS